MTSGFVEVTRRGERAQHDRTAWARYFLHDWAEDYRDELSCTSTADILEFAIAECGTAEVNFELKPVAIGRKQCIALPLPS